MVHLEWNMLSSWPLCVDDIGRTDAVDWCGFAIIVVFFSSFFDKLRIFSTSIDATVFVLDCFLELTLVGSSKDLAIIHSDTILVAEG
jgi:hypothetical protein